jgi:hypothetical protein
MHPDLVVFLPGITGSVLMKDEKVLWGYSPTVFWNSLINNGLDLLEISGDDNGDEDLGDGIDGISLLAGRRLIAAIFRRAGNDHPAHPIEDLLALGKGQAVEVFGQVQ